MYNRYEQSSSGNIMPIIGGVVAVGFVLFLFMPSLLDKIRNTTDIGRGSTGTARKRDETVNDQFEDNENILADDANLGAV